MRDSMTEVDVLHERLQAWAAWLTAGTSGAGYPTKSVLHSSWLPPTPGSTPTMRTTPTSSTKQQRELHAVIQTLCLRLQNTLVVVYLMRVSPAVQATLLDCQPSTVRARVAEAKQLIANELNAQGVGRSNPQGERHAKAREAKREGF